MPDEQSGEVGGLQNTVTNLGASIGTALAGAVLIVGADRLVLHRHRDNPAVPDELSSSRAGRTGAAGSRSSPTPTSTTRSTTRGVEPATADAIVDENADARLDGLRASLAVLGLIALVGLFTTGRIPTKPPGATVSASSSA